MSKTAIVIALGSVLGITGIAGNMMHSRHVTSIGKSDNADTSGHDDTYFANLHLWSAYSLLADGREETVERYNIGGIHNKQSNRDRAINAYKQALELLDEDTPEHRTRIGIAYDGLAKLYERAGNIASHKKTAKERDAFYRRYPDAKFKMQEAPDFDDDEAD